MTHLIVGGFRTNFTKMKPKEYMKTDKDSTTTAVYDMCQPRFKEKAPTQQSIPLKMNAFHFNKNR